MENLATTEQHKGVTISIHYDTNSENPFENWDGLAPLMMQSGSRYSKNVTDYSKGDINNYLKDVLTDGQIIRHQTALADAFEVNIEDLDKEDKISEIRYEIGKSENFDALTILCELAKVPHLNTYSRGYSQGSHADIFICETPEFLKVTGLKELTIETMESGAELFGHWAWGDVYSFITEDENGDILDSCSGFYGDDYNKSGLMEEAKSTIDYYLKKKQKDRFNRLKELIKANVPYYKRQSILNSLI